MTSHQRLFAALDSDPIGLVAKDGFEPYVAAVTHEVPPRQVRIQLTKGRAITLAAELLPETVLRDEEVDR